MPFLVFDPTVTVVNGIETPVDNSNATSYGSVAGLRAYAKDRKKTVPVSDSDCQVVLILAMDYLEAKGNDYQGQQTAQANLQQQGYSNGYSLNDPNNYVSYNGPAAPYPQTLQWPRCGVFLYNSSIQFDSLQLPPLLLKAQYELAILISDGVDLFPISEGSFIKSEKIDVIETVYSEVINTTGSPSIPYIDAILGPLMSSGGGLQIRTYRA